jgi:superfamily I DNA/RNA helicase
VFEEYRNLLEESGLRESTDAMRDAASLLERREAMVGYRSVLVDEAQDMSTVAFELIRRMIPTQRADDIFIVGDGHQRIYRRQVALSRAGINVVGRSRRLRINYRTTDEIRRFAVALLEGLAVDDLDEGVDTTKGYKSLFHGEPPRIEVYSDLTSEADAIASFVLAGDLARTCLVARTNALVDAYVQALETRGVPIYRLRRSSAEDRSASGLRVATMHRVKGLEFDRVVVAGANEDVLPLYGVLRATEDEAVRTDIEMQERGLLYVAITRAKREVLITTSASPSRWLTRD